MILRILTLIFLFAGSFTGLAQSRFFTDSLFSKSLNEYRRITVYLPHSYDTADSVSYPVIYTTDGQLITESYRHRIDSLIEEKLIKPVVLIASHSNEKPAGGVEYRNLDYMRMRYKQDFPLTARFDQHMQFFTKELRAYAESNYRVSDLAGQRSFFGVSNGADFGVSLAQDHPEFIKNYVLLSVFNGSKVPFKWKKRDAVYFYLGYGLKEPPNVSKEVLRMEKYLISKKLNHTVITWNGGHERPFWEQTFIKSLIKLVPF
ncbi:putative esterase [compost metagenome]